MERTFDSKALLELIEKDQAFVAFTDKEIIIGFILLSRLVNNGFIEELDVLPAYGRRGVGRMLIERALQWMSDNNLQSLQLSTFADVEWNAPLYSKYGFSIVPENQWTDELRNVRMAEKAHGLPIEKRVFMVKKIATEL